MKKMEKQALVAGGSIVAVLGVIAAGGKMVQNATSAQDHDNKIKLLSAMSGAVLGAGIGYLYKGKEEHMLIGGLVGAALTGVVAQKQTAQLLSTVSDKLKLNPPNTLAMAGAPTPQQLPASR